MYILKYKTSLETHKTIIIIKHFEFKLVSFIFNHYCCTLFIPEIRKDCELGPIPLTRLKIMSLEVITNTTISHAEYPLIEYTFTDKRSMYYIPSEEIKQI